MRPRFEPCCARWHRWLELFIDSLLCFKGPPGSPVFRFSSLHKNQLLNSIWISVEEVPLCGIHCKSTIYLFKFLFFGCLWVEHELLCSIFYRTSSWKYETTWTESVIWTWQYETTEKHQTVSNIFNLIFIFTCHVLWLAGTSLTCENVSNTS